jgi:hypothetical protein
VGCGFYADSKNIIDREQFQLIDLGGNKITFKNINGKHVSA